MAKATKEPKAKKPRKQKAKMALDEIEELLGKIEKAEQRVADAEAELNGAKEEAKTAKGVWLTAVKELRSLCRKRKQWAEERKKQPLLAAAEKKADETKPAAGETPATDGEPDAWRKLPIDTLKLPPGLLKKLGEANLLTLGDFAAHQEKKGEHWATDIAGVGSAAAGKISDAWEAFWAANPQYR